MKASNISSLSVSLALRNTTARMQAMLPRLQQELVTSKHYDNGLALGSQNRKLVSFKNDIDHMQRLIDTNSAASTRLEMTQDSMGRMNSLASELMNAIGIVMGHDGQRSAVKLSASNVLAEMTSILNTQAGGEFIFAGLNASQKPIQDYATGPAKAAFDAAFSTYFGFTKNDPAAAAITQADMQNFLTTQIEPMFTGPAWNTNVSSATDDVMVSRISPEVTAKTSVSANEQPFRQLMLASVVASELYDSNVGGGALDAVSEFTLSKAGSSAGGLTELQGRAGLVEERLTRANDGLKSQKSLFETFASDMESIDPYQTSIELNSLLTQIETSFSITSRIKNLSIMQYL